MDSPIEKLLPNEVISCLWNKNASEKCRIGLTDTLVFEGGLPARWYVTNKTGEVVKKRSVDIAAISDRWMKICNQYHSSTIAIIRQDSGVIKVLPVEAWKSFIDGSNADSSIMSAHCYVKGPNSTIYRNRFWLKDNLGRFSTSTTSYTLQSTTSSDSILMYYDKDFQFVECRAKSLRNVMDLATNTVVRYLEMMLQIKVLNISIDYIIDSKSQLWLLWTSAAEFVKGTSLAGIDVDGLHVPEKDGGRMSWAGPKYAEEYHDARTEGRINSPSRSLASSSPTQKGSRQLTVDDDLDETDLHKVSARLSTSQMTLAISAIDEAKESSGKVKRKQLNRDIQTNVLLNPSANNDIRDVKFPDPFKCKGDYCHINFLGIGALSLNPDAQKTHTVDKMFTKKEMEVLRKHKDFGKMMVFSADGPGLAALSMKSIVLARQERRGLNVDGKKNAVWDTYPLTPRQKSASLHEHLASLEDAMHSPNEESEDGVALVKLHQGLNDILGKDKEHRRQFGKGMATYYDQIRVCGICYNMYSLFDWARDVLGKSDPHTFFLEAKGAGYTSSQEIEASIQQHVLQADGKTSSPSKRTVSAQSAGDLVAIEHVAENGSSSPARNRRRKTWRDANATESKDKKGECSSGKGGVVTNERKNFADLDSFLRGGASALAEKKAKEKGDFVKSRVAMLFPQSVTADAPERPVHRGRIIFGSPENDHAIEMVHILEDELFEVSWVRDGRHLVNELAMQSTSVDCIIVHRNLELIDAFKVVKSVRDHEKDLRKQAAAQAAADGKGLQPQTKRFPVICFTSATSPQDIKSYMAADMDGCISFPINKVSLLSTVRAAIPHHLATIKNEQEGVRASGDDVFKSKVSKLGPMGTLEGSLDSATVTAKSMALSGAGEEDIALNGVIQIDADTRVPYMVLDASRTAKVNLSRSKPYFNLVVCHDLFDTAERFKIFMRPIVERFLGMQVLLWNYPGQAFTEWRKEQLLNNEYMASCLNEVLGQVGDKGTKDFDTSRPFYLLGFGNGANIATFYAAHYVVPNLRCVVNVNGWAYVDSYLAGIMHDCINIFQCAPPSRPDLPVYFMSRFMFAKDYLAKVSVPLALNIYTAVHNPISLHGRICLCKGVLQAVDIRGLLKEIDCPMVVIQSTQDTLARPMHSEPFVSCRGGEVRSVYQALKDHLKTCVIWMKAGHEVFQECRKPMQTLIEQFLTGYHESNDITFPPAPVVDRKAAEQGLLVSNVPWETSKKLGTTIEDKFIDKVMDQFRSADQSQVSAQSSRKLENINLGTLSLASSTESLMSTSGQDSSVKPVLQGKYVASANAESWEVYSKAASEKYLTGPKSRGGTKSKTKDRITNDSLISLDPSSVSFGRENNLQQGSTVSGSDASQFHEVKEYMSWRLKRNKKRLQRLQGAARIIQSAYRAHLARKFVRNIRRHKAAAIIQRCFRGWLGKCSFMDQARRVWAALMIQRTWRGYLSRKFFLQLRRRIAAASHIQRMFRGHRARLYVRGVKRIRYHAASLIQALYRKVKARKEAWRRKMQRNASIHIQRIYRGHLGRRKSTSERDKYIFSKSQSQGIEFGRQMLLEHKLHATKLQSDVTLLTQEKVAAEEHVEALLEEISSFEEGVRVLEKEMHQLSRVESEASGFMDEDSRYELREQKIRLDKEFGEMLTKISTRKDMLNDLEKKLSTIDKTRQSKEEELRTLERKLVVLLEEQQNELNAIKRKQDVRGAMLAASHQELLKVTSIGSGAQVINTESQQGGGGFGKSSPGGGGGGSGGPSFQEKKQAAQLMQSTETLMKFGFMSMSMTYFSSLNMIKALRTVSAQDTVMAALSDVHSQRAVNHGTQVEVGKAERKGQFIPDLKAGQLSGQESLRVSAWSVEDVSKWLQTISLGQYSEAFIDAAIDGEFLYDLNDDDLKNTLGIEHRLHRKKILQCVHRLKLAEAQADNRINALLRDSGGLEPPVVSPDENAPMTFPSNPFKPDDNSQGPGLGGPGDDRRFVDGPKVSLVELFSFVRHSKLTMLKEAIDYLPNKKFDKSLVKAGFVEGHGTVYMDGYERLPFHMNKTDEYGNTMLSLGCQNGNMKICKYLVAKGSNPNHQNNNGQTPAHFAISYKFFELSQWLFENGAQDSITNKYALTPYDGLAPDGEEDEQSSVVVSA